MYIERTNDDRIIYIHEFFTQDECKELINKAEAAGFTKDAKVITSEGESVVREDYRSCKEIWLNRHPDFDNLNRKLKSKVKALGKLYQKHVAKIDGPLKAEEFRFVRYHSTDYFRLHADRRKNSPTNFRQLSVVIHLTTLEGGQTVFPSQGLSCPARAGSVLIFPSTDKYMHEAVPPAEGETKYILLSWLNSPSEKMPDEAKLIK